MTANAYRFISYWRVEGTVEEVSAVLGDAASLPRWWPAVYLAVKVVEPGEDNGVGKVVELHTKGWLPYTLHWFFRVTESHAPNGYSLEAWGDFDGTGVWTFRQNGSGVDIVYDWKIRAEKPLLRYLSFVLKPVFSANHRWAMARGEESLRAELGRRAGAGQQSARHTS
jgi:polyketide cyclase/dehydrase/lipid transport protein